MGIGATETVSADLSYSRYWTVRYQNLYPVSTLEQNMCFLSDVSLLHAVRESIPSCLLPAPYPL
jgi:hypothetical protein